MGGGAGALGAAKEVTQTKGQANPSVAVAERRVRQLRALGQGQSRPRAQAAGHDRIRISARGAEERAKLEQQLGANPFKFGLASGSDAHTGLAAMEEDNFFGKFVSREPGPSVGTRTH